MNKYEQNMRELWDSIKKTNPQIMGIDREKRCNLKA
jgi:hypothetical protein